MVIKAPHVDNHSFEEWKATQFGGSRILPDIFWPGNYFKCDSLVFHQLPAIHYKLLNAWTEDITKDSVMNILETNPLESSGFDHSVQHYFEMCKNILGKTFWADKAFLVGNLCTLVIILDESTDRSNRIRQFLANQSQQETNFSSNRQDKIADVIAPDEDEDEDDSSQIAIEADKYKTKEDQQKKHRIEKKEEAKPCYFPTQECLAQAVLERIRLTLEHYHNKSLATFKDFDSYMNM